MALPPLTYIYNHANLEGDIVSYFSKNTDTGGIKCLTSLVGLYSYHAIPK